MTGSRRFSLLLIVILLLVQFGLRAHHPLAMAAFWDENSHITRARALYAFESSPISASHGKLLLYFWLGLFRLEPQHGALAVARWAIALASLVGAAGMVAAARELFGRRVMIPALAFYALVPYAVFFDRMAFADPFAGALASLTVWMSIRLARRPSRRQAVIVGALVSLAALAKLTTAVIAGMPVLAVILLSNRYPLPLIPSLHSGEGKRSPGFPLSSLTGRGWGWIRALWNRYRETLIIVGAVAVIPWLIVLGAGVWLAEIEGEKTILLDTYLIGDNTRAGGVFERLETAFVEKTGPLLSHPMVLILLILVILLLWKRPAAGLYVLGWLAAIWIPITLVATELQSRYLMAGVPALAVIFGGGTMIAGDWLGARLKVDRARAGYGLAAVIIGVWAVGFALPFFRTLTGNPAVLKMPHQDETNYFSGLFTTWGTHDAFIDLADSGERVAGQIPAVGVMRICEVHVLVMPEGVAWDCMSSLDFPRQKVPRDVSTWTAVTENLDRWPFVYVLTDYLPPGTLPENTLSQIWEPFGTYPRPYGGDPVTVWRVAAR